MKRVLFFASVVFMTIGGFAADGEQHVKGFSEERSTSKSQPLPKNIVLREILVDGQSLTIVHRQILAKLQSGVSDSTFFQFLSSNSATLLERAQRNDRWVVIETPENQDVTAFVEMWRNVALFEHVGFNVVGKSLSDPNDPYYSGALPPPSNYNHHWAFKNTRQEPTAGSNDADIDADLAWDLSTGSSSVAAAVLDFGIPLDQTTLTLNHPDLDDPNRFLLGQDFTPDFLQDGVRDPDGHGTHVTGIWAAEPNNAEGVAGVDWNCRVWTAQVFFGPGIIAPIWWYNAVTWVVEEGHGDVINFSGGFRFDLAIVREAVEIAQREGVLICAASGNGGGPGLVWPAKYASEYSNVVSVGATDPFDNRSWFSSYGSELVVSAPGGVNFQTHNSPDNIVSTLPPYAHRYGDSGD